MELKEYASKRTFDSTPEPQPSAESGTGGHRFVVQKHAARVVHYDLRLEVGGVLKSWSVPRGPSLDPSAKRLAVRVEDHPLEYREFEGIIPEGNYGAGGVIIWDRGRYHHPAARDEGESDRLMQDGLRNGNVKFVLEGEKLRGAFALARAGSGGTSWLLMKKKDAAATQDDILRENRSVASHRTLAELIASAAAPAFRRRKLGQVRLHEAREQDDLRDAPPGPAPRDVRPMLASAAEAAFDHPDWLFEVKWDGFRAVAGIRNGAVSLSSRNGISLNAKFPAIVDALREFGADAVLDGEIVVTNDAGVPDFQMLQRYREMQRGRLLYAVFDLLHFEGRDLTGLPLIRRKGFLQQVLPQGGRLRFSDHIVQDGILFFEAAREKGLEGIVAKFAHSVYEPGRRTQQWLKVRTRQTQDAVIAGFTEPRGGRPYFGSLVLGVFEGEKVVYIGHAGSGYSATDLREIRGLLEPLVRTECPFDPAPESSAAVTWVRPELVCEVAFSGWTQDGVLRQPVFLRLRQDKDPRDAVREGALRPDETK